MDIVKKIVMSYQDSPNSVYKYDFLLNWIKERNREIFVKIDHIQLNDSEFWFYDDEEGVIRNKNNSFFKISGLEVLNESNVITRQPIILQDEIGYLGLICKEINGVLHFLMQAKIEPGNINKVQISPTIQATKSNFLQKHGGKQPDYLKYFINAENYQVVYDQIQSEQSSRFLGKRNRNIIVLVEEEVEEKENFKWMTLYQIHRLMKEPNLVNMDTRTVLSGLPFIFSDGSADLAECFNDKSLFKSIYEDSNNEFIDIYQYINNFKMFNEYERRLIPLSQLEDWGFCTDGSFSNYNDYSFNIVFCNIQIDGREVKKWNQPLFKANGEALFGLFTCVENGIRKFLIHAMYEVGAFDIIELGPSVQREAVSNEKTDCVYDLFMKKLCKNEGVLYNNMLSEEGGRFYHEQNKNVIIEIDKSEIEQLPSGYFWVTYKTLNLLIQVNNTLNIQLRNLLSLLDI